jgi:hypothetical protein
MQRLALHTFIDLPEHSRLSRMESQRGEISGSQESTRVFSAPVPTVDLKTVGFTHGSRMKRRRWRLRNLHEHHTFISGREDEQSEVRSDARPEAPSEAPTQRNPLRPWRGIGSTGFDARTVRSSPDPKGFRQHVCNSEPETRSSERKSYRSTSDMRRRPYRGPAVTPGDSAASSRSISDGLSTTSAAATSSSRWFLDFVPGMGTMSSPL